MQNSQNNKAEKIIVLILLFIGLLMLGISAFIAYTRVQFIENSEVLPGTIVDYELRRDSEGSTTFHPIVEYTDPEGIAQVHYSNTGSNRRGAINQEIEILYNADAARPALINRFVELWLGTLITGGIGLVFSLFGIAFMIVMRKSKQSSSEFVQMPPQSSVERKGRNVL